MSGISGIISTAFRGVRIGLSILGIGSSLGIAGYGVYFVIGGTTSGIAFIVMGGLCLIPSIVMLRDASSVLELIKEEGKKLEQQNGILKESNIVYQGENEKLKQTTADLMKAKDQYAEQNQQYLNLLKVNESKIENLDKLIGDIQKEKTDLEGKINDLGEQTGVFKIENSELKGNVERINTLREQFKRENSELQLSLKDAQDKLMALELVKEKFSLENDRLHELLTENSKQVTELAGENTKLSETVKQNEEQIKQMEQLVADLKQHHEETKRLLKLLVITGDKFSEFENILGGNVEQLGDTTEELKLQIEQLKQLNAGLTKHNAEELRIRFDRDGDGTITDAEFREGLASL